MAISIGDVLEVVIRGTILGQTTMTVLHYTVGQAPTQQDPLTSQDDFLDLITTGGAFDLATPYRACTATNFTLGTLSAQYIWPTRWIRSDKTLNAVGTGAGATGLSNVSSMVEKKSARAGRKNRGAIHMPAPPDAEFSGGKFLFGYITDLNTLATAMEQKVVEGGGGTGRWDPYILHRTTPLNGTGVAWETHTIMDTIRVQRRRTLSVGI